MTEEFSNEQQKLAEAIQSSPTIANLVVESVLARRELDRARDIADKANRALAKALGGTFKKPEPGDPPVDHSPKVFVRMGGENRLVEVKVSLTNGVPVYATASVGTIPVVDAATAEHTNGG